MINKHTASRTLNPLAVQQAPMAPQPLTPEQLGQVGGGDRPRNHNY